MSIALACPICTCDLNNGGCPQCGKTYPDIANVRLVVPEPENWAASYYDSALATLMEFGITHPREVAEFRALASAGAGEPLRFSDDWTDYEENATARPRFVLDDVELFAQIVAGRTVFDALVDGHGTFGRTAELGPGAGELSARLCRRASTLVVCDISLRSVFMASRRAGCAGLVMDADALAFATGALDTLVAANVIDLLASPMEFLQRAKRALVRGGRLLLSTPDPALGTGDDDALDALLDLAGFDIEAVEDGLAWVRAHSHRHVELYVARVLRARRR